SLLSSSAAPRTLHSFPTRRSSDLFLSRLCVQAVNRLFEASGAGAVLESDAIQRFHRDAHGASHHVALVWDAAAENFGRVALGLRSEEHTSELQSRRDLVCRLLLEK